MQRNRTSVLISKSLCRLLGPAALLLALFAGPAATAAQAPASPPDSEPQDATKPATRVFGVTALSDGRAGYHVDANGTLTPEPFFLLRARLLVVDFPGVFLRGRTKLPPAVPPVRSLRLAQFTTGPPAVARFVLGVDRSIQYRLIPDSTGATIVFGNPDLEPRPAAESAAPATPSVEPTASPTPTPGRTSGYPQAHFTGSTEQKVCADF